ITCNDTVCTTIGVATTLGAALWLLQTPPAPVAPTLGLSAAALPRLFGVFFTMLAAGTLCLSHGYNRERGISGEEYPSTVLFATFGMLSLASATNLLTLFLGLVAIDLNRATSGETGLKYLLPGALSAAFLAFGIALLYSVSGTLSIHETLQ